MTIENTTANAESVRRVVESRIAVRDWQSSYVVETDETIYICDDDEYGEKLAAEIQAAI